MPEIIELSDLDKGLIEMINDAVKTKMAGEICAIENLLDPTFFEATESEHIQIGKRISSLVSARALPLEPCGLNTSRHNQYRVLPNNQWPVTSGHNTYTST